MKPRQTSFFENPPQREITAASEAAVYQNVDYCVLDLEIFEIAMYFLKLILFLEAFSCHPKKVSHLNITRPISF